MLFKVIPVLSYLSLERIKFFSNDIYYLRLQTDVFGYEFNIDLHRKFAYILIDFYYHQITGEYFPWNRFLCRRLVNHFLMDRVGILSS